MTRPVSNKCNLFGWPLKSVGLLRRLLFSFCIGYFAIALSGCGEKISTTEEDDSAPNAPFSSGETLEAIESGPDQKLVTCYPGCRFELSETKPSGVPDWCESWTAQTYRCEKQDGEIACRWQKADGWGAGQRFDDSQWATLFETPWDSSREDTPFYFCHRIDTSKLRYEDRHDIRNLSGYAPHLRCSPGCLFGDSPSHPDPIKNQPAWCEVVYDGCNSHGTELACDKPANTADSCVGIKLSDHD